VGESFSWEVPLKGFKWVGPEWKEPPFEWEPGYTYIRGAADLPLPAEDESPPWLVTVEPRPHVRLYFPLEEEPGLYRKFARLRFDQDSILRFANHYGELGAQTVPLKGPPWRAGQLETRYYEGESLHRWRLEIQEMRDTLELWDSLGGRDGEPDIRRLKQLIVWNGEYVWYLPGGFKAHREFYSKYDRPLGPSELDDVIRDFGRAVFYQTLIAGPGSQDWFLKEWLAKHDVIGPARQQLAVTINRKLRGSVSPLVQLLGKPNQGQTLHTTLVPRTLLAAMWLQLYFDITGKRRLKQCIICGTYFDATKDPRQLYCRSRGTACRKKAYRIREKVRQGKSIEQVAREANVSVETIRLLMFHLRG